MKLKKEMEVLDSRIESFAKILWYIHHPKSKLHYPFKNQKRQLKYVEMAVEIIKRMIDTLFCPFGLGEVLKTYYNPEHLTNWIYQQNKLLDVIRKRKKGKSKRRRK